MIPGVASGSTQPEPGASAGPGIPIGDEERKPCTWSVEFHVNVTSDDSRANAQKLLAQLQNAGNEEAADELKTKLAKLTGDGKSVIVFLSFICIDENGKVHRTFKRIKDDEAIAWMNAVRLGDTVNAIKERDRVSSRYTRVLKPCCDKKL